MFFLSHFWISKFFLFLNLFMRVFFSYSYEIIMNSNQLKSIHVLLSHQWVFINLILKWHNLHASIRTHIRALVILFLNLILRNVNSIHWVIKLGKSINLGSLCLLRCLHSHFEACQFLQVFIVLILHEMFQRWLVKSLIFLCDF